MGQSTSVQEYPRCEEDWPYVWAIRDQEQLDWKLDQNGVKLPSDKIEEIAQKQSQLPVEISSYLYLGAAKHAHNISLLKEKGITHVLNVAGPSGQGPLKEYQEAGITVLNIDADDEEGYQMLALHFKECYEYIESIRLSGGKCVVHCVAGINRSGVIVAACYMLNEKVPILDTVAHCRTRRGNCFLWNTTFQEEIVAMARQEGLLGPAPGEKECRCQNPVPPKSSLLFENKTSTFNSSKIKSLF
jgi:hypothetical protein